MLKYHYKLYIQIRYLKLRVLQKGYKFIYINNIKKWHHLPVHDIVSSECPVVNNFKAEAKKK